MECTAPFAFSIGGAFQNHNPSRADCKRKFQKKLAAGEVARMTRRDPGRAPSQLPRNFI